MSDATNLGERGQGSPALLLAELESTELMLRSLAIEMLSYRQVMQVERIAHETCNRLLVGAPVFRSRAHALPAVEEATDELLVAATPVAAPLPGAHGTPRGNRPAIPVSEPEAVDEGPEGIHDDGADLRSDERISVSFEPDEGHDLEDDTVAAIQRARGSDPVELSGQRVRTDEPPVRRRPPDSDVPEFEEAVDDMATTLHQQPFDLADDEGGDGMLDEDTDEAPVSGELSSGARARPSWEAERPALAGVGYDSDVDREKPGLSYDRGGDEDDIAAEERPYSGTAGERSTDSFVPEPSREPEPEPGYVTSDSYVEDNTPASRQTGYLEYTPGGKGPEDEEDPTDTRARPAAGPDPWANLVSFAEPEKPAAAAPAAPVEDEGPSDDPWAEQRRAAKEAPAYRGPSYVSSNVQRPAVLEAGADALVTMDQGGDDVVDQDLASPTRANTEDEEVELEIENTSNEPLQIDPEQLDAFGGQGAGAYEEDEVTLLRASSGSGTDEVPPSSRPAAAAAPKKAGTPIGGAARGGTPIGAGGGGLFGGAVPTIRSSDDPRPRAAAVQLNAPGSGGARMLGSEEEDIPIEIGEAEGLEDEPNAGGGFSLKVQEYEDEYEDEEPELENQAPEDEEPQEPKYDEVVGPSREELQELYTRAQAAAAAGELQSGADLYSDLLDQDPDNVDAHVARGRLYLDLGDYSRAMSDFMVAEDLSPADPEPQVAIGDLYFARKDYRKAIDYFNAALELNPNHAMAFCRRGISHYYRKSYQEAVADLLKAQKLDADIANIQTYVSMAKKKAK